MLQESGHIKNTVVLIFGHIHCLHLRNSEVAWVLVSSGTQVQLQIILDLFVSYEYDLMRQFKDTLKAYFWQRNTLLYTTTFSRLFYLF